ncbi:MAG: hypothetical protein CVU56_25375 [Deltaproteobacteria bacterium HGW-Deltaproteobacteria-14]|jgi:hypothetical protein|nr:MAG: hypothetical protein CVU56_25375 [Deltaproteobacteria bacterium HGW-Deltaproteobacteria-14]
MTRAALAALSLIALSSPALADVPPPPGYVEQCTVDKQQQEGEECVACGTYHGERDKCEKLYGEAGYGKRCSTGGASVWTEVWCRKQGTGKPVGPAPGEEVVPTPAEPTPAPPEPPPTPAEPPAPTPVPAVPEAPAVDPSAPTTVIPAPPTAPPQPTPAPPAEPAAATPAPPAPPAAPEATKKTSGCAGGPLTAPLLGSLGLLALLALRRRRSAPRA